jgi:hypothetical protein
VSANPYDPTRDCEKLVPLIPHRRRYPILPPRTPKQEVALLCRVLFREGYDEHITGHITCRQDDGNGFPFLWETMARRELRLDPRVLE